MEFKFIRANWPILVALAVLISQWGVYVYISKNHENRITRLEQNQTAEALVISEINSRLASIETSILFIKDRVK